MKLKELAKNGEKYADPTAFQAIKNTEGTADMQPGEIWEMKQNVSGSYRTVIVLAVHEKLTTILQINDSGYETCIKVNCPGIKYTDPCRIQYAFNDTFCNFVRTLKDEEFGKVMDAVALNLGLTIPRQQPSHETKAPMVDDAVVEKKEQPEVNLDLIKANAERDVYKKLYEELIQKVMS